MYGVCVYGCVGAWCLFVYVCVVYVAICMGACVFVCMDVYVFVILCVWVYRV